MRIRVPKKFYKFENPIRNISFGLKHGLACDCKIYILKLRIKYMLFMGRWDIWRVGTGR
jgi:hypothetical protein